MIGSSPPVRPRPSPWAAVLLGLACLVGTLWYWQAVKTHELAAVPGASPQSAASAPGHALSTIALAGGSLIAFLVGLGLYAIQYGRRLNQRLREEIEDHEEAQDRLRRSEGQFRQVVEHISEVFWLKTPDQKRFLYVSPAYETIWGRACRNLLRNPEVWLETVHPEDRERLRADGAATDLAGFEREYRILRPDGAERWIRERAYPVRQARGGITALVGSAQDITAYKEAALAVQRDQRLVASILDGASEAIYVKDLEGRYVLINQAGARFLNKTVEQVIGQTDAALFPASFAADLMAFDRRILRERATVTRDEEEPRPEGKRIFATTKSPYLDPDGRVIGLIGMSRDVTEQRLAEARLRQSEAQLYQLFFEAPVGLTIVDDRKRLLKVNQAFCDLVGYREEEIIGNTFATYTHPDDLEPNLALADSFFRGERTDYALEKRYRRKNGEVIWVAVTAKGIRLPSHSAPLLLATVENITARKQAEAVVQSLNRKLEGLVEARTAQLAQTQSLAQQVIDSSPDWIFVKDREHRFLLVNQAFATAQSLTPRDMIGRPDTDFWSLELCEGNPEKQIRGFHTDDREAFEGRTAHNPHDPATLADGSIRIFDTIKSPLRNADGPIYGVLCYCRDVTEQRRAQEALQQGKRDLERHVAQRTAELALANHALQQDIAARKQAEAALRLVKFTVDRAADAIFWIGPDGAILDVNHAACRLFEYSRDELVGKTVPDIDPNFPPEAWPAHWAELQQRGTFTFESSHRTKNGGIVQTEVTVNHLVYDGKEYNCAFMRDITARRQAEESLRFMRFAVDRAGESVFWIDAEARIHYANDAARLRLGYTREELLGMCVADVDPLYQAAAWPAHWEDLRAKTTLRFESLHRNKSGEIYPVEIVANYVVSEGKEYNVAFTRDISDRKRAESALRAAELRYRTIFEQAGVGVAQLDSRSGRFLQVNRRNCEILGLTEDEMLATTFMAITYPEDLQLDLDNMDRLLRGEVRGFTMEKRLVRKDGGLVWVNLTVSPLWQPGEESHQHLAVVEDITERKRAEEALRLSEQSIRELHQITSGSFPSFDEQVKALLDLGCRRLGFPIGMLTRVQGESLELSLVHPAGIEIPDGTLIPLCGGPCAAALQQAEPLGIMDWEQSPFKDALGHTELRLASYLGTRLVVRDHPYGTICFLGPDVRTSPFTEVDRAFVQLIARWVEHQLAQQQANRALVQSEARYRLLYDDNPSMYFTLAVDGTILSVNQFGAEQLGYTVGELIGQPVLTVFHEQDRSAVDAQFRQALTQPERSQHWEFRKVRKDGTVIWVGEDVRISQTPDGQRVLLVVCEDITDRKRAEEALISSEARLRMASEASNIGLWDWSLGTDQVYFSKEWKRQIGHDEDEVSCHYAEWERRLHPDDRDRVLTYLQSYLAQPQGHYDTEFRLQHKDGSYRWIHARGEMLRDAEGVPARMLGCHIDITERKAIEDRLQATQYAVDHAADQIFVIGPDGYFRDVNESACRRLGYTKQELLTMSVMDIDPDFPPTVWNAFWAEFTRTKLVRLETRHRSKSGEVYPIEVVANYHLHNGQELDYAIVRDISERRKAEEERSALLRELQSANTALGHLSHQLMQIQETERQQLARDLHDEIGQALTAVTINLQSLGHRLEPAGQSHELKDSLGIVDGLIQHVRDLCLDLRPSMLDDLGLVPALRWYVTRQAARAGWTLNFEVDEPIPALPELVQVACFRIAQEAITNAMRHAGAHRLWVQVRCADDSLILSVTDDGIGFAVQVSGGTAGLGLLGMKERARSAGGEWTIDSTPGHGTTVRARLPINGLAVTKAGQFSEALS